MKCGWIECRQGTDEWRSARCGRITASKFKDVLAKGRAGDFGDSAKTYARELAIERLTEQLAPDAKWKETKWGHEHENGARATYTLRTGRGVDQVGFATHPEVPMIGCSCDGLVDEDGTLEIKCPWNPTKHLNNLQTRAVPGEYRPQVHGQLYVTGRLWCDFMSYDPRYPDHRADYRAMIVRVERNDDWIEDLDKKLRKFNAYVDTLMDDLAKAVAEQLEFERG